MSGGSSIGGKLGRFVWERASSCCEYCGMPQRFDELPFEVDHIIAEQHGGKSMPGNLALACFSCNRHKGPNLGGIDPKTGRRNWLFHPRRQKWTRHFRWVGPKLVGRTGIGRATVAVLAINDPLRVRLRIVLIANGELRNRSD
jgi:HNH endonuclease